MNPTDRAILEEFAERVREIEPRARIWAFGSRVRGKAEAFSDLDVCVVLPEVNQEVRDAIGRIAWEISFEHELLIQDVIFSEESLEHGPMSASPLVKSIMREGLAA